MTSAHSALAAVPTGLCSSMLTRSAQHIAKGNYSEPIPNAHRHDEIGLLQGNFQKLQFSLATHVHELEQLKATLSERGEGLRKAWHKAQEANRMKTAFLHNMTNQMVNPSKIINERVEQLSNGSRQLTQDDAEQMTKDIQKQATAITELLKHMLDDSETVAGKEVEHE